METLVEDAIKQDGKLDNNTGEKIEDDPSIQRGARGEVNKCDCRGEALIIRAKSQALDWPLECLPAGLKGNN